MQITSRPLPAALASTRSASEQPVNEQRLVDTFVRLIQVPGPSLRERPIADQMKKELAELGLTAREDDAAKPSGAMPAT